MCGRSCALSGAAASANDHASSRSRRSQSLILTARSPSIGLRAYDTIVSQDQSSASAGSRLHQLQMSERDILAQWLNRAAWRLRLDLCLREAAALTCWLLCAAVLYQAIRVLLGVHEVLAALLPLFVLGGAALVVLFASRLSRRPTLQQAAAVADRRTNLNDQLGTALWFAQQSARSPMIELLLERAARTIQRLEDRRLFPIGAPRSLPLAAALMLLAVVLACLSPRVAVTQINIAPSGLS